MQAVDDVSRGILGHGLDLDGVAGAVYNRRGGDSVWTDIPARQARGGRLSAGQDAGFPEDRGGTTADALRVHRVDRVIFRGYVQNILVSLSRNPELAEKQRLAIDLAVHSKLAHFSKRCRIHIAGIQRGLFQVLAATLVVVVIGHYVRAGRPRGRRPVNNRARGTGGTAREQRGHKWNPWNYRKSGHMPHRCIHYSGWG